MEGLAFLVQAPVLHAERFLDHYHNDNSLRAFPGGEIDLFRSRYRQNSLRKLPGHFQVEPEALESIASGRVDFNLTECTY